MSAKIPIRFAAKRWTCGATTKASLRHQEQQRPGQDAAFARLLPRPIVLVSDGRGSSEHSDIGAAMAADCVADFVDQHEALVSECLDQSERASAIREEQWKHFACLLGDALVERQAELARIHALYPGDLEFTLAAAVVGRKRIGVIQVGDSCVAIERHLQVQLALPPHRGEFANETNFICPGDVGRIEAHTFAASGITGLVAFTDGLAPHWLDVRTMAMAPGVGRILRNLGDCIWDQQHLDEFLDRPIWHGSDNDDRGVAYLAMKTMLPSTKSRRRRPRRSDPLESPLPG
jgi:hypothetical protein